MRDVPPALEHRVPVTGPPGKSSCFAFYLLFYLVVHVWSLSLILSKLCTVSINLLLMQFKKQIRYFTQFHFPESGMAEPETPCSPGNCYFLSLLHTFLASPGLNSLGLFLGIKLIFSPILGSLPHFCEILAHFSSVQSLSRVQLFVTPWTAARQASLSITNSWSLLKLMPIESVMPSNHLILYRPLLLLP